jgi:hypothetical protein
MRRGLFGLPTVQGSARLKVLCVRRAKTLLPEFGLMICLPGIAFAIGAEM